MAEQSKAAEVAKDAQQRLDDSIAWGLSTEQGRRLLFHLAYRTSKLEQLSYTGHAESAAFNEGQRSVGRWLVEQLERVDPDLADKMVLEGRRERRSDRINATPDALS